MDSMSTKNSSLLKVEHLLSRLYLIFEYLTMDLKKYLDTSIPSGEMMDPMLVKSYTYQILQGILFCHQVTFQAISVTLELNGSACGSVGRVFASEFYLPTVQKKRKKAGNGPSLKNSRVKDQTSTYRA